MCLGLTDASLAFLLHQLYSDIISVVIESLWLFSPLPYFSPFLFCTHLGFLLFFPYSLPLSQGEYYQMGREKSQYGLGKILAAARRRDEEKVTPPKEGMKQKQLVQKGKGKGSGERAKESAPKPPSFFFSSFRLPLLYSFSLEIF